MADTGGKVDKRVRIRPRDAITNEMYVGIMQVLATTGGIIFPYTPTIVYEQNPNWAPQELTHFIQQYYYFTSTSSAKINITGDFTVQNQAEGQYLLAVFHFLRSYSKMHFGVNDAKRGLPPPVLLLDAYGDYMFNQVPIIITNWNMEFNNAVDYVRINTGGGGEYVYLPTKTSININATVQKPPNVLKNEFNLQEFRTGSLLSKGYT